jgi:hypothetical protein
LALALVVTTACAPNRSRTMPHHSDKEWSSARAVAEAYAAAHGDDPAAVRDRHPAVPFLFDAGLADRSYVLVHGGRVLDPEGTGLDGLGHYLAAIDAIRAETIGRDDMLVLVHLFGAYPPIPDDWGINPQRFVSSISRLEELAPPVQWQEDHGALSLYYVIGRAAGGGGAPPGPTPLRSVQEWTLVIPSDYQLSWKLTRRVFDVDAHAFRDDGAEP